MPLMRGIAFPSLSTLSGFPLVLRMISLSLKTAARVFAFLSGPPDYGAGQLDTRRYGEQYASRGEDADRALLPEQTPFYKELVSFLCSLIFAHSIISLSFMFMEIVSTWTSLLQAAVAVQAGVCVDIFAVTNEYTDLASLKFLSIESGGSLLLYTSTDDSTLPQDMWVSDVGKYFWFIHFIVVW